MAGQLGERSQALSLIPKNLLVQQAHLASLMWPTMAAFVTNYAKDLSVTPSSSPSPPISLAHTSPGRSPGLPQLRRGFVASAKPSSPPPAHSSSWFDSCWALDPPQSVPEDLRVVSRKMDFQAQSISKPLPLLKR